jgi:hypothetical protein
MAEQQRRAEAGEPPAPPPQARQPEQPTHPTPPRQEPRQEPPAPRQEAPQPPPRQMAELEARLADSAKPVESAGPVPTKEELDAYGEDLFKLAERYLMPKLTNHMNAALAKLEQKFAKLEAAMGATSQQVVKSQWDQFLERLDGRIDGWREIDNTAAFNEWLDGVDPFFGVPRREALDTATRAMDDARVVKVFEAFLSQQGATVSRPARRQRQQAAGTGAAPTAPDAPPAAPSLEDFAAPGRPSPAQSAPPPANNGPEIWTIPEIQAFYRDRAAGVFRSRPEEADRIEREIAAAQREGRVRQ